MKTQGPGRWSGPSREGERITKKGTRLGREAAEAILVKWISVIIKPIKGDESNNTESLMSYQRGVVQRPTVGMLYILLL
jgi:hypothetical protein